MKQFPLSLLVLVCLLAGFVWWLSVSEGDVNGSDPNPGIFEEETALQEPPILTVFCRETSVEALRGTTSWWYENGDGTQTGVNWDGMHPLQAVGYVPALYLLPSSYSRIDPYAACLRFKAAPDVVTVRCWSGDSWGQMDDPGEDIPVEAMEADPEDGQPGEEFAIQLKEGSHIYEVTAQWNRSEQYGGTARYSFYTVEPELVLIPETTIPEK